MSPIKALLSSRKFLLLVLDTVVSLILFFVGKYAKVAFEDVKYIVLALQPVFIVLISAIAYEDGKVIPAQISLEESKEYNKTVHGAG
jgi:hypothetical protein